ncbi:MAG: metallophosphoesterase [Abitibacteriaceae bacterium]|nr:metallophosphoesterase [Abditibacteriaceae bacterium]
MSLLSRAAALTLAVPIAYSLVEPHYLRVRHFTVCLEGMPAALDGLRVVQLSDLHFSAITSAALIHHAVDLCNAQQPDLVVLTGDYVSRRNSYSQVTLARRWARPLMEYGEAMAEEVARLKAPLGIFAVPGNHDYSMGSFEAVRQLLNGVGVKTLVNESLRIEGSLPIVGLDDLRASRPLLRQACEGIAPDEPHIILSHNPRLLQRVPDRNCLMLSGHTHGGQVHLPFTSFRKRPHDMGETEWHQGWYRHGQAQMYVSAGVGSVHFPMRFRCPPEMPVFTFRA